MKKFLVPLGITKAGIKPEATILMAARTLGSIRKNLPILLMLFYILTKPVIPAICLKSKIVLVPAMAMPGPKTNSGVRSPTKAVPFLPSTLSVLTIPPAVIPELFTSPPTKVS